jgi:hypothetical protein
MMIAKRISVADVAGVVDKTRSGLKNNQLQLEPLQKIAIQ